LELKKTFMCNQAYSYRGAGGNYPQTDVLNENITYTQREPPVNEQDHQKM